MIQRGHGLAGRAAHFIHARPARDMGNLKIVSAIGLPIFITVSLACLAQPGSTLAQDSLPPEYCRTVFFGAIGQSAEIEMLLYRSGKDISGTYVYAAHRIPIRLSGTVEPDNTFLIKEYPRGEISTGTFAGKFLSSESLAGVWSNEDGSRHYSFSAERQRGTEHQITLPREAPFRIVREPLSAEKDALVLVLKDQKEIPFYEESCSAYLAANTVDVQLLSEDLRLWLIEWQTEPEGHGQYTAHYYLVIQEGRESPLLIKGWVSSGAAGGCTWGRGVPSIEHTGRQLRIIETQLNQDCNADGSRLMVAQFQIERVYDLTSAGLRLVHAEHRQRDVEVEAMSERPVELALEGKEWERQVIPLEQAMEKYPAIQEGYWQ